MTEYIVGWMVNGDPSLPSNHLQKECCIYLIASFINDASLKFNIWKLYILFKKKSGPF